MAVETHDIGRFYWHVMRVPWRTPLLQLDGLSHEVEEPWRVGRAAVLRLLFLPVVLVLGVWGPPRTYEQMLEGEGYDPTELAHEELAVAVSTDDVREDFRAPLEGDTGWAGWVVRGSG